MIFSKKQNPIIEYTVEFCNQCKKEDKRKFKLGDTLFLESGECNACKGKMIIKKIYGEVDNS